MSSVNIKIPDLNITILDNTFVDHYMADARGDFVKLYIYLLRVGYPKQPIALSDIASALNLLQTDVQKGLEYWEGKGILRTSGDSGGTIEILSPSHKEMVQHDVLFDKSVKSMFNGIEALLGRLLSSKELTVFMSFIEDYKFSTELIYILLEYCISKQKTDIRYIEKVAISWHEIGIRTLEDAQKHISKFEDKWTKYREITKYMGLKDHEISKPQEDYLEKWLFRFHLPVELVKEACKITIMNINECNFKYIDTILCKWHTQNVTSLEDLSKLEKKNKPYKKNQAGTQNLSGAGTTISNKRKYDAEELEKLLLGRGEDNEK